MISEVTNECNMQMMARYPDGFFDLAAVDLEYGIGASKPTKKPNTIKQKNGTILNVKQINYMPKEWDFKKSSKEYLNELFRVSKRQIIFGGNYYGLTGGYIVWDKLNGETDQFGCELAWTSFSNRTDIIYYMWSGMFQGESVSKNIREALRQQGNKSLNEKRIHPTQKPVKLYEWLLMNYAETGQKIIDTHLGSQSSRIAAHNLGFDFYGCELDFDYFKEGCKRYDNHILQQRLF
jgi:site-specific DNA-methyltransferase (adenine-specific)